MPLSIEWVATPFGLITMRHEKTLDLQVQTPMILPHPLLKPVAELVPEDRFNFGPVLARECDAGVS
jgi:hypothetical protein